MTEGKPYDVIVLGAGLSGLLTAALLAKRGRHVLVLEEEKEPGGLARPVQFEGFRFFRGPALYLGFEREGLYDRLFMELGISLSSLKREGTLFRKINPPFQVVFPNHRINFYEESPGLSEELSREFPDHSSGIQAFLTEIIQNDSILTPYCRLERQSHGGFRARVRQIQESIRRKWILRPFRRRRAGDYLDLFHLHHEVRRGFECLLFLWSGMTPEEASEFDFALILALIRHGMIGVGGGNPRFCEKLVEIIHKYQGDVIYSRTVKELVIRRKKLTHIKTDKETIGVFGDCVVNMPAFRLPECLNAKPYVNFYFGINAGVIPAPMKNHLLLVQLKNSSLNGYNLIFLVLSDLRDDWAARAGERGVRATLFIEEVNPLGEDQIRELLTSTERQLGELIPFSNGSIKYLGHDVFHPKTNSRLRGIDSRILHRGKRIGSVGPGYYTFPVRNLFALPDSGQHSVAHLWEVKSASELANRIIGY